MRDVEAQLIHDMQNTATVLREAASQLHRHRETLPPGVVDHLFEMMDRRSDMLVHLLRDLTTAHLAERGELELSLQRVSLPDVCRDLLEERQPEVGSVRITVDPRAAEGLVEVCQGQPAALTLTGRWLAARRNWTFCFVVACLSCMNVPLGTILGVFTILVLQRPGMKGVFGLPLPGGYLNR